MVIAVKTYRDQRCICGTALFYYVTYGEITAPTRVLLLMNPPSGQISCLLSRKELGGP